MSMKNNTKYDFKEFDHTIFKDKIKNQKNIQFHTFFKHIDRMCGWSIDYHTYFLLMNLLQCLKPSNILELGYGYSTILFQQYAKFYNKKHTVIESDQKWIDYFNNLNCFKNKAKIVIKKTKRINLEEYEDILSFVDFSKGLESNYDFVLIDAPKGSPGLSRPDIFLNIQLLSKISTIIIHDADRDGEKRLAEMILDNLKTHMSFKIDKCFIITNSKQINKNFLENINNM